MHTSFLMDPIDRVSPWGIKVDPYSCFYLNTFCFIFSYTEEQYASPVQKKKNPRIFSMMNFLNRVYIVTNNGWKMFACAIVNPWKCVKAFVGSCCFCVLNWVFSCKTSNVKCANLKSWEGALFIVFYFLINRLHFLEQLRFIERLNRKVEFPYISSFSSPGPSFVISIMYNNL